MKIICPDCQKQFNVPDDKITSNTTGKCRCGLSFKLQNNIAIDQASTIAIEKYAVDEPKLSVEKSYSDAPIESIGLKQHGREKKDVASEAVITCPQCHSTEWRLASLVHHEGFAHINTSSTGGGIGVSGGGVGVGAFGSSTTGTHQTMLSALVAPPKFPEDFFVVTMLEFFGCLFLLWIVLLLVSFEIHMLGVAIGTFIITIILFRTVLKNERKARPAHEVAMRKWKRSRVCIRCGKLYDPSPEKSPLQKA